MMRGWMKAALPSLCLGLVSVASAQVATPDVVASPAVAPTPAAIEAPAKAPTEVRARLVWFGGSKGISGKTTENDAHRALYAHLGKALSAVVPVSEAPRVFARGRRLLLAEAGLDVKTFHGFLAHGPFTREVVAASLPLLDSPTEWVFELPTPEGLATLPLLAGHQGLSAVSARLVRYTNAQGGSLLGVELPGAPADAALTEDPYDWELRVAFIGRVTPTGGAPRMFFDVAKPINEGSRRVPVLKRLRADGPGGEAILVAGGRDIEHFSFVKTGAEDLQRPNTWAAYRDVKLNVLVPGPWATAFGLDALGREAQESGVTLVSANVAEAPFSRSRRFKQGDAEVLVVGVTDPDMRRIDRLRGFKSRQINAPGVAVCKAIEASRVREGRRPDAVVVVGDVSPARRAQIVADCPSIDLLLTDFGRGTGAARVVAYAGARPLGHTEGPLTVAEPGGTRVGVADLYFERGPKGLRLLRVESATVAVTGEQPIDSKTAHAIQKTRQDAYAPAQATLLPDLGPAIDADPALRAQFEADPLVKQALRAGGTTPGRLTPQLWRTLVVNTLHRRLGAELTLLPHLPVPWALTGSVSRLEATADLNVPDDVVVLNLDAEQLAALLGSPHFGGLVTAGHVVDADGVHYIEGRPVDGRERYRVVVTDALRADPRLAPLLGGARLADDSVTGLKLRDVVLDTLAEGAEVAQLAADLHPRGAQKRHRWVFDIKGLALGASLYRVLGEQDAYTEVRESRVTTGEHLLLRTEGDLYAKRQHPAVDWVNRARFSFAEAQYADTQDQETADELLFSTELQAHALAVWGGVPYSNVAFITEFTPTEGALGDNPRKKRLEGAAGLLWSGAMLKEVRLGAVLANDFAEEEPDPQVGALAVLKAEIPLGAVIWTVAGEGRYYLPNIGEDRESELGVVFKGQTGLQVPVVSGLSLALVADVYGYRGQTDLTEDPGASLITGLLLKYDRVFKPGL